MKLVLHPVRSLLRLNWNLVTKLRKETLTKYKTLDKKLSELTLTHKATPKEKYTFHPRVINNTDISFTNSEKALLQKGLKYNLHAKKKNWPQTKPGGRNCDYAAIHQWTGSLQKTSSGTHRHTTAAEQLEPHPQHTPRIQADKVRPNQTSEKQRHDNTGGQGQYLSHTSYKTIRIQDTEFDMYMS